MKQECTLVQGKCDKTVISAMPSSHHLKSENILVATGELWWAWPPNKSPSPTKWNITRYKSVVLSNFRMSKALHSRKSPLLKIFWRRFWFKTRWTSVLIHSCSTNYVTLSIYYYCLTSHCLSTHTQKSQ